MVRGVLGRSTVQRGREMEGKGRGRGEEKRRERERGEWRRRRVKDSLDKTDTH